MSKKKTKLILYVLFVLSTFLLLFARSSIFIPLKFSIVQGTTLPVRVISWPFQEFKKILLYHRTFKEYIRLRREVNSLKARLVGFDEVVRENTRLEGLLELKRELLFSSVAANVIGRDPSNWNATIIVDKGRTDGLNLGMPVVNAHGVVGKIAEVSENNAKVILISDPSFSVAALSERSREVGLVSGTLKGLCRMRYLSAEADVQEGDLIITSKLSSSFPEGLIIGTVLSVSKRAGQPTVNCLLQPAVALSQIEEVLVIQKQ